jgi:hypothetical protein
MEERRGTMSRKKFTAVLAALVAGAVLSAGSAWAVTGYLMGDPSQGKLVPYYKVTNTLATVIGIASYEEDKVFSTGDPLGEDVSIHVTIWGKRSNHILDFDLCLSPLDFGYIVLQQNPANHDQLDDLAHQTGPHTTRAQKARVYSVSGDGIPTEGYLTLRATQEFESHDGTCAGALANEESLEDAFDPFDPFTEEPMTTWAILLDAGNAFFATEIPTPTAIINFSDKAVGGFGAFGLIPFDNTVIARFDVNPINQSHTDIYVWLASNAFVCANDPGCGINRGGASLVAQLDCEDEFSPSTTIFLPDEVNVIDPNALAGIGQCKSAGQYRGQLRFNIPDTGFLWSQISQENEHFRETFLGYNLECNEFVNPSDCD